MVKLQPPRDFYRLKSKTVSGFLNFTNTKGWVCLCMLFATGSFWLFGIKETKLDYAGYWIALVILFAVLPQIVFRVILKYRDVPKGWTLEQFKAWRMLENSPFVIDGRSILGRIFDPYGIVGFIVGRWKQNHISGTDVLKRLPLAFVPLGIFWVGVIMFINLPFSLWSLFGMMALIGGGWFVYFRYMAYRYPNEYDNNTTRFVNATIEAKYGRHYKLWILVFGLAGFVIPIVMFELNMLWFIPIYIVLMIFLAMKAGAKIEFKLKL
jgi:hypothetical protein